MKNLIRKIKCWFGWHEYLGLPQCQYTQTAITKTGYYIFSNKCMYCNNSDRWWNTAKEMGEI